MDGFHDCWLKECSRVSGHLAQIDGKYRIGDGESPAPFQGFDCVSAGSWGQAPKLLTYVPSALFPITRPAMESTPKGWWTVARGKGHPANHQPQRAQEMPCSHSWVHFPERFGQPALGSRAWSRETTLQPMLLEETFQDSGSFLTGSLLALRFQLWARGPQPRKVLTFDLRSLIFDRIWLNHRLDEFCCCCSACLLWLAPETRPRSHLLRTNRWERAPRRSFTDMLFMDMRSGRSVHAVQRTLSGSRIKRGYYGISIRTLHPGRVPTKRSTLC